MRSKKSIEDTIRTRLSFTFDPPLRGQLLARALREQEQSQETQPALGGPAIRRMIMKNSIVKLGIAAAVIAVFGMGIMEFLGTGSTSGTLWAQVARNVEASPSVIFRTRGTGSRDPNDDWPNGCTVYWRSATVSRMDKYRGGQIHRTIYTNLDTKTLIGVLHDHKMYNKEAMSDERVQQARTGWGWIAPQELINLARSLEHHALGQKTIDGVLCEGIEAKGPDGGTGRLWVAVETGYPVLAEIEGPDGHTGTMDQFRWNVDLSAEGVEPEIPAGYSPL